MRKYLFPTRALYGYEDRETSAKFEGGVKREAFSILLTGSSEARIVLPRTPDNSKQQPYVPLKFDGATRLPERFVYGWYIQDCEPAKNDWENMRRVTENETQRGLEKSSVYKPYKNYQNKLELKVNGIAALWAIRAYFVGPDTSCSPPYVVVLCSNKNVSRWLVDDVSRQLSENYENWYATRLPNVKVLQYGPGSGDSAVRESAENKTDDGDDEFDEIRVRLDGNYPTMVNGPLSSWTQRRHRCGIKLVVTRDSDAPRQGTIGGVVSINGRFYGLTVGHIFSPQAEDTSTHDVATGGHTQPDIDAISTTIARWQQQGRYNMSLDWALVDLPMLRVFHADNWNDMNLVQTVSGDFRPVLTASNEPQFGRQVVLATPRSTYGLRGFFVGSEAVVNIPASDAPPYVVWALRMEMPWLIQKGDSGSWAFDAITGDLLGILIAGCPDLLEAYILPAYQVFNDINSSSPDYSVKLPNGYSMDVQFQLAELIKTHKELMRQAIVDEDARENITSLFALRKKVRDGMQKWRREKSQFCAENPSISNGPLINPNLFWVGPSRFVQERRGWLKASESEYGIRRMVSDGMSASMMRQALEGRMLRDMVSIDTRSTGEVTVAGLANCAKIKKIKALKLN
ncbi:hypothetical protein F5Y13DRAFT_71827 [Hypoxylon sp. FL1857]|nr:hypothetical protein F5Y13DRAFT_71827 [Hypoxylon sp. FL1857]